MKAFICRHALGVSVIAVAVTLAQPAYAQDTAQPVPAQESATPVAAEPSTQLEEIIVTAQKRAQNLQDVPIAITAVGSQELDARNIETVIDLGRTVPGLNIQNFNGIILPFLRGVGTTSSGAGVESSVAVYLDGVYFSRLPSSFFDLANVDRVEVLKGPQGTLFGRNSTGGVINVVTKEPSFTSGIQGSVGYGNYDAVQGKLYATAPLSDTVAMDISLIGKTSDGFGFNNDTGHRYGYEDSVLARSNLLFKPSDDTSIRLSGFYSWSKNSGNKAAFPGTASTTFNAPFVGAGNIYQSEGLNIPGARTLGFYESASDPDQFNRFETYGGSLRIDQDVGIADLVSISAYSSLKEHSSFDDYVPEKEFLVLVDSNVKLFTQELQLVSKAGGGIDWIAGLYYYNNLTEYTDNTTFEIPIFFGPGVQIQTPAKQKVESFAAFAQVGVEITPDLTLTGGFRYTFDKTSASGIDLAGPTPPSTEKVDKPSFKISLDYQATPDVLLYALFARGFKSGGYNILTYNNPVPTDPEELDDYEVGIKADLFDRRLRVNASAFYYKINNPQVALISNNTIFFSNAGGSEVKGIEADLTAAIIDGLSLRASATYLDSKYTDYGNIVNGACVGCAPATAPDLIRGGSVALPAFVADGNRTPLAAKLTFNVGGDYVIDTGHGELTFTADWYHNSGYTFEPDLFLRQKAHDLVGGQIKFAPTANYAVRIWGKNLLDQKIVAGAASQVGNAGYPWSPAAPRTYGVALDFRF